MHNQNDIYIRIVVLRLQHQHPPDMHCRKKVAILSIESIAWFAPIVQRLDLLLLGCEHMHEEEL